MTEYTNNRRVLVIDDEVEIRKDFEIILGGNDPEMAALEKLNAQFGDEFGALYDSGSGNLGISFDVVTAEDGQSGYEAVIKAKADHNRFAVAFIDMRMPPGWDGAQTASEIRKIDSEIEIVIVTAYSDKDLKVINEMVGDPSRLLFVKKPFAREEIEQLAYSLTEKWNLNQRAKLQAEELQLRLDALEMIIAKLKSLDPKLADTVLEKE